MELQKTDILTLTEEKGGNMLELIGTKKEFSEQIPNSSGITTNN